jgi:prepilin-type N-terminal cleavage/methylation domain-containing protein
LHGGYPYYNFYNEIILVILRSKFPSSVTRQAFSLLEMLIVIGILGILAAVAIAFLGGTQREAMIQVRDQRNAQEVASLTMGALAVGAPVIVPGDMRGTIDNLLKGTQATTGTFAGRIFRLSELNEEEISGAMKYLKWQDEQPVYLNSGSDD